MNNYDGYMDKECIELCDTLNSLPGLKTFESCCGHLKACYSIWFFCDNIDTLSRLGRTVEKNYSDGKWEIVVDSTDTHPRGVFWLRTKSPFVSQVQMNLSLSQLISSIKHWFKPEFDAHFSKPSLPSNLDEAAEKATREYVYNEGGPFPGTTGVSFINGFKAGAEWKDEQFQNIESVKPLDWWMDKDGNEHCHGYESDEVLPWPAEVYVKQIRQSDE